MRRQEAVKWIGKPVYVWTAMNGEYTGILEQVIAYPGVQFRARVRIKEVMRLPVVFELGRERQRKPFPENYIIEVGAVSIKKLPIDYEFSSYKETLEEAIRRETEAFKKMLEDSSRLFQTTKKPRYVSDIYVAEQSLRRLEELREELLR